MLVKLRKKKKTYLGLRCIHRCTSSPSPLISFPCPVAESLAPCYSVVVVVAYGCVVMVNLKVME